MKKVKLFFVTIGALVGVTGAYATCHRGSSDGVVYNWHIADGQLAFSATIAVARAMCPNTGIFVCLRGTAVAYIPITLHRP